jgi:hypothetical protein
MISGKLILRCVSDASAVLERQFVHSALTNGSRSKDVEQMIRQSQKYIEQINQTNEPIDAFPFNFLAYIKSNLSRWTGF